MAAEILSAAGVSVQVHEAMASPARKFLMAGRGGLNLTHSEPLPGFVARYGEARGWVGPWLDGFAPDAARAWADGLGADTFAGSSGRVFPRAMKASPLLRAWLARLADQGVRIVPRSRWTGWDDEGAALFADGVGPDRAEPADALVLALGGASWPRLGSDGGWVRLLEAHGVMVTPLVASNAGVVTEWSAHLADRHAGQVLKGVAVSLAERRARGDLVLTRTGLEGGPVYALGPAFRDALARGPVTLQMDLRPEQSPEELAARLARARPGQSLSTLLKTRLSLAPVAVGLLHEQAPLPRDPAALAARIKAAPVRVTGLQGLERAISSAGGIRREALDPGLMLTARPGVFACGEMLDWDAPTGGYLLQACLASGAAAARGVLAWLRI